MAKSTKAAPAAPAPTRKRAVAYAPTAKIAIVGGEEARRVVKSQAVNYAMNAMRKWPTVGEFNEKFGALCTQKKAMQGGEMVAGPMPGRATQPGPVQAQAILRWLEKEGAVVVK